MKYFALDIPEYCPSCNSQQVVPILYGEPGYEVHLDEVAGKIILGGCIITGNDPAWGCLNCRVRIYKKR